MSLLLYPIAQGIKAFSTERGCTCADRPYEGFNVTHYSGDDPSHVRLCRQQLSQELGTDDRHLVVPHQIHGTCVAEVTEDNMCDSFEGMDALTTTLPHTCIGVSTADCVPILLYDRGSGAVAAIHAGWRGTVARIASATLRFMHERYGTKGIDIRAIIGPSIGPEAFEVGDEVYEAFVSAQFPTDIAFKRPASTDPKATRWHIDLWQANASDLMQAGVPQAAISIAGICTFTHYERFFSARRLGILSGRIFTGIMRTM